MNWLQRVFQSHPSTPDTSPANRSALQQSLRKTRAILTTDLGDLLRGKKNIDAATLEDLETRLLMADVGISTTEWIIDQLRSRSSFNESTDPDALMQHLFNILCESLQTNKPALTIDAAKPFTFLVIGVNGSGKTTTIGKLAHYFKQQNQQVLLAAGDTFRAAAIEQLQAWGQRNDVAVIAQQSGADSAAVIFDALQAAQARKVDILIADTAGRLHTQQGLMDELKKVKRVLSKLDATAPHETLLVLDASSGQNALVQARQFHEAIGVTGLVLTKLDGTAKGGIVFAISRELGLPIRFIGVGEKADDLRVFEPVSYVAALLDENTP
ncbi:MAG: signal recognition particle-docking protein FtsY [Gammaproteobacteria bacterium]|nr:signal recognition particle-docking protein FtsY [Gammaproteobacteria bacterium]